MNKLFDSIIIGGGPAGISSALYLKSRGLNILLIEKRKIGGLAESVTLLTHFIGLNENEKGEDFGKRMEKNLKNDNVDFIIDEVVDLSVDSDKNFNIKTKNKMLKSKTVIVASGSERLNLKLDGIENFQKYARDIKNKTEQIAVIAGGSDGACKEGIYLSNLCKEVHLVEKRDGIFCIDQFKKIINNSKNIFFHKSSEIVKVSGNPINTLTIHNNSTSSDEEISGDIIAFSYIGQKPELKYLNSLLPLDDNGFIDSDIETFIEGLYVVGDVRKKSIRQIATAVSDGALVAPLVYNYLNI